MTGKSLSHYVLLEKVGEGGMGVVYKARDAHLDRLAAIKILPAASVADPERKRRFVQEAKLASSLNHPNIVHIYDIDTSEGVDFIAMEYVVGRTLNQLIERKGLGLNEALKIGIQVADALARAHAAGIVHRDLKPSNVMVTENGLVKVLDFGLAKLAEPAADDQAPTETREPVTQEGAIVGTVGYMSPEQAEGKKVDARSDIFSLGAVLYEMVTGQRAFQADSRAATLAAVLQQDPKPISSVRGDIPPELEKLIARCLRKDPARRAQDMADLRLALEELKEESDSGRLLGPRPRRQRVPGWAPAVLAVVAVVVAAIAWWLMRPPKPVLTPTLTRLTWDSGLTTDPALSSDGKLLAYASDRSGEGHLDIYVQQVGGGEPLRLTQGPGDKREPAFSPDGTTIAFRSEQDDGIYLVSALGGPARRLVKGGHSPQFSPDGKSIAYSSVGEVGGPSLSIAGQARIYVVPSVGGAPRQVRADFVAAAYPTWSPDGEHLLFLGNPDNSKPPQEAVDWWVTPLSAREAIKTGVLDATRRAKLSGDLQVYPWVLVAPAWEPDGNGLVFSARSGDATNLWRIGISPRTWKVIGAPQRLTSGPTREESPSVISDAGGAIRVAFASANENTSVYGLPIKPNEGKVIGEPQLLTHNAAGSTEPSLSRDGKRMVYVSLRPGNQEVWIKDLRTGQESALTASGSIKYSPAFSPDGSKVSFLETASQDVYMVPATGGAPEMVCEGCGEPTGWSPDGKRIIGNTVDGRAWVLDVASRRKTDLLVTRRWVATDTFSPDGRWFSFLDAASWRGYVAPFSEVPVPESGWIDATDGEAAAWSPDGSLLYATSGRDGHFCIWAQRVHPVTKRPEGAPFAVFHSHNARLSLAAATEFWLSVAGGRMVFSMGERTGNIWMAEWKKQ